MFFVAYGLAPRSACAATVVWMKKRVDTVIADQGLAPSRSAAARSVRAGQVRVGSDGPVLVRPSDLVETDADLVVTGGDAYVSRGGEKLANALDALPALDPAGRTCLDIGASTGGFTDCLLQRGAKQVMALDVGHGQLDWRLRNDERVRVVEDFNARELSPDLFDLQPDLVTVDVSFISLTKILAPVASSAAAGFDLLAMVKPQFELGRKRVGRGGVVRDPADRAEAILMVAEAARAEGLHVRGFAASGLTGPKGNRETFIWCDRDGPEPDSLESALAEVEV